MRDHRNYFGLAKENLTDESTGIVIPQAFLMIDRIEHLDWRMSWSYQIFWSAAAFDAEKSAILNRSYWMEGAELDALKAAQSQFFSELDSRYRGYCLPEPTENAEFQAAIFNTLLYTLNIDFLDSGKVPNCRLFDLEYHNAIQSNIDIVAFDQNQNPGLIPLLHAVSAQKDSDFFNGTSLVLPE